MSDDYKNTVFLPATPFPMKADLPNREPKLLERWQRMDLYGRQRQVYKGRPTYVVHDGPPYANGHLHMGHALNKILKDVIIKAHQQKGYDTPFVPGWDCHGLPIEWQIEEQFRREGRTKDDVPVLEFRQACRADAEKWIRIQSEEFQRLGVLADWQHPYTTLSPHAEATIVSELLCFLMKGAIYLGERPIMWSVVEGTALAEAEVEYKEKNSNSIYVKFPIHADNPVLQGVNALVWTTTPWTLPGNRAIAFAPGADYAVVEVMADFITSKDHPSTTFASGAKKGDRFLMAADLVDALEMQHPGIKVRLVCTLAAADLSGAKARHPLFAKGYGFEVPFLPGDHVTLEQGTGLVHTAPGHGEDDFYLGKSHGLEVPKLLGDDGVFFEHVPLVGDVHVFKADPVVIEALQSCGTLFSHVPIKHSYPHSWRSKAPLIFRTTPQWFLSMSHDGLREKALRAIDTVTWHPPHGRNRIRRMVENRPDWCLSRQRAWGVPLTFFVHKVTGEVLKDKAVNERIMATIHQEGTDAWYTKEAPFFLEGLVDKPDDYRKVTDSVDVWFDSGSTHAFVLESRPELTWPADLYIEGSDQHRGWFQSSLLESCGTRGVAPFKAVLTHGFVVDDKGHKMSKSVGNVVSLDQTLKAYGADVLRLWVVNSDYQDDLRIGKEIMRLQQDYYRRFRNTLRYLLGALGGWSSREMVADETMPPLEKYMLSLLAEMQRAFDDACETLDFQSFYTSLHTFCTNDLSAFYFDIRKDVLYCDGLTTTRRGATRTVMRHILTYLLHWLAPVLTYTAEEAYLVWLASQGPEDAPGMDEAATEGKSLFLTSLPPMPASWYDADLMQTWRTVRELRRVMTGALEKKRAEGAIGSSLQASITLYGSYDNLRHLETIDVQELAIVSQVFLMEGIVPPDSFQLPDVPGVGVVVSTADGAKCERCWVVSPRVGADEVHPTLCPRCAVVLTTGDYPGAAKPPIQGEGGHRA